MAAPAFWVGRPKGAKTFLGGQVYMVANNSLPQYGTHTPLSKVPLHFPWSLDLFSLLLTVPFFFISLAFPSSALPSFDTARGLGSAVSSQSGSGRSPAAKWNLVNSGPRNERFLTCQSGKLQCSQNSLMGLYFLIQWQYELFWSVHKCDIH